MGGFNCGTFVAGIVKVLIFLSPDTFVASLLSTSLEYWSFKYKNNAWKFYVRHGKFDIGRPLL